MKRCCLLWLVLICTANDAADDVAVDILLGRNAYHGFLEYVGGRDPAAITDYSGQGMRREVMELLLLHRALNLGGNNNPINLSWGQTSYPRRLRMIAEADYAILGNTVWLQDVTKYSDELYISSAVIERGQYIVGLYTHRTNLKALTASSLADVQSLTALSNKDWSADWKTLEGLQLPWVAHNPNWYSYGKILADRRIDFTLSPFQLGPEKTLYHRRYRLDGSVWETVELIPIPNIQVYLDGSRHWIISRRHPQGRALYEAIEAGLKILNTSGRRRQALVESGFIPSDNKRVTINADQKSSLIQ